MKFFFTIDAFSAAGDKAWRLQQDQKSWRACTYAETASGEDARIFETSESEGWTGRKLKKDSDHGLIIKEKTGTFDFLVRGIYSHAVLHRQSAVPLPGKEQMIETMASLPPGTPWLFYLNVAGQFKTIDTNNSRIIGNLDIAVRGEIASSEEYIGPKAAEKEAMMDELYHQFLAGWDEHLQTSQMAVFVPDAEKLKEESFYADRIQNWQPE